MFYNDLWRALTDLVWPPRCVACSARTAPAQPTALERAFCPECMETTELISSPKCVKCSVPFEGVGPDHICGECLAYPPPFREARALLYYGGAAARAAQRLKYGAMPELATALGRLLETIAREMRRPDLVVPVPLHVRRLKERGFNQSTLLAREVAGALKVQFAPNLIRRTRETSPQAGLSRSERLANLKDAFEVCRIDRLNGKQILLLDDVVTTGATIREVSRTLVRSGAGSVSVIALARAS